VSLFESYINAVERAEPKGIPSSHPPRSSGKRSTRSENAYGATCDGLNAASDLIRVIAHDA
jgi:hypothetical protein